MKMRVKRIIACLLTGLFILSSLAGCGAASGSGGASSAGGKILFLMTDTEDAYRALLSNSVVSAASSQGVSLDMVETGSDVQLQLQQVSEAKGKGYSAIILRLADSSTAPQMNVASNDLPIIYVNSEPDSSKLTSNKFIYVGSDEMQAGQYQAEFVLKKLGNPSSLNIIIFQGEAGHSATIARTKAVKQTMKANGCNANYVFIDTANWSDAEAKEKLGIFMKTGQSVDAIICNNDSMALGAIEGMKEYGLDYTKIPVCGVDATSDACASIEAGEMAFTVLQDAKNQAAAAVTAAATLGGGGDLSTVDGATSDGKYVYVPFVPVDASNVAQYK